MATASQVSRSTLANWLKQYFYPRIVHQYYNDTPLFRRLESRTDSEDFVGKKAIVPVKTGWSEAVGARADGSALPGAYYPPNSQMEIDVAQNYGVLRINRSSMKASRNSAGAWARFLQTTMDDVKENLAWDRARQAVHGDATGALCTANGSGSSSTSLTVTPTAEDNFIRTNMVIDVYTATSGGSQEINSIRVTNVAGNVVTLESAQTWTDGSYVFREDSRGVEMMGLGGIIDDWLKRALSHLGCSINGGIVSQFA